MNNKQSSTWRPKRPSSTRFGGSRPSWSNSKPASSGSGPARPHIRSGAGGRFSRPAGGSRFPKRAGGKFRGEKIDFSRFVNKAIITEEVERFVPEHKFADFKIQPELKEAITKKGYELPTPIQDRTIPHILAGQDVVGIANTGTGKTGAFLVPLINKVLLNRTEKIMIIVPTRELAIQIDQELRGFTPTLRIFSACCVGGAPIFRQISDLKRSHNFVIGTPGRIKDLIKRKCINLSQFSTVVLDEADRMLDMGFVHDMRFVMSLMPTPRHTLFFSATLSREIEKLIGEFLTEPVRISVKTGDTAKNVDQDVVRIVRGTNKTDILHDILIQPEFNKVIIFGRTKFGVENLANDLIKRGFKADAIHGDKNHAKRQRALRSFKENQVQILVATDVAARGLDIPDVSHVINYDLPSTYDDYVHRIGRTGRGGKTGKALTFVE